MCDEKNIYLAHSKNQFGLTETVQVHLENVKERTRQYARALGINTEAQITGLLHDAGKYGDLFQERLKNPQRVSGVDHWSMGAWIALSHYKAEGIAAALAIQGHHIGLQSVSKLEELKPSFLGKKHPLNLTLSESDTKILIERMRNDGLKLPDSRFESIFAYSRFYKEPVSGEIDIRMLYSVLVDADFIETEAHVYAEKVNHPNYRKEGKRLNSSEAMTILAKYIGDLQASVNAKNEINRLRNDLLLSCQEAALSPTGLFTLTAPTGAGKTLGMLSFALKHAHVHNLRRIIVVIPYLSIIEQTADIYRKIFGTSMGKDYILEHHSLSGAASKNEDNQRQRLLSENWDAPVIITTSVQFLESLFANRSSSCRKLHRIAKSVVLFDEVQTLPPNVVVPTLAALSRLAEKYSSTVVFSTATQPAFSHLDSSVKKYCAMGWQPKEIAKEKNRLFSRIKRTSIQWPNNGEKVEWEELAQQLIHYQQALCIVNMKKHAQDLFQEIKPISNEGLLHLSTNMCPAHRRVALEQAEKQLKDGERCHLISTQCIEAGVDIDFPVVFRAFGPLEAIAQAAGRCNRNGIQKNGKVVVFTPVATELYPDASYKQAAHMTNILLRQYNGALDIDNPKMFEEYYKSLYVISEPSEQNKKLIDAIRQGDFVDIAENYRIIPKTSINVLVPYKMDIFEKLREKARTEGLTREWVHSARPYSIGIYRPKIDNPICRYLEPISVGRSNEESSDWFIYSNPEHYDSQIGLVPPNDDCLIA